MMLRTFLKSKIHRATVTDADVHYVGSVTIDRDLIDRVNLEVGELVHIWNVNNGERLETYVLEGKRGAGEIVINGAAARKVAKGDLVIISAFCLTDEPIKPQAILVDQYNHYVRDL